MDSLQQVINNVKTTSDIMKRCQQIVNQHLQDTIPKSINDTRIQYKTVIFRDFPTQSVRIYLKTSTENNENLCKTFCISINIPFVTAGEVEGDTDVLLSYLQNKIGCTIEFLLIRLIKGVLANDLTAVVDTENRTSTMSL